MRAWVAADVGLVGAALAAVLSWQRESRPLPRQQVGAGEVVVEDGDGILWRGEHCRIAGHDAPELAAPWLIGDQEPWASQAKAALEGSLARAARIEIAPMSAPDRYGRPLVHVYVDGVPVGVPLIRAGLAVCNVERYGHQGLPGDARALLAAAREATRPAFDDPHVWRRTHSRGR